MAAVKIRRRASSGFIWARNRSVNIFGTKTANGGMPARVSMSKINRMVLVGLDVKCETNRCGCGRFNMIRTIRSGIDVRR